MASLSDNQPHRGTGSPIGQKNGHEIGAPTPDHTTEQDLCHETFPTPLPVPAPDPASLAEALLSGLVSVNQSLLDEQSVHGIDALDETGLHPVLASGIETAGWGVHREVPYPGDLAQGDNDRDRCDLVVTEKPGDTLSDPVHAGRRVEKARGTLFEPVALELEERATSGHTNPADACWIEIKAVAQTKYRQGIPVPNRAYGTELVAGPIADATKLASDGIIRDALVALVVFTATPEIARADIATATHRLFDKDIPVGSPSIRGAPIEDKAGNAFVTVAVFPLRGIGLDGPEPHPA